MSFKTKTNKKNKFPKLTIFTVKPFALYVQISQVTKTWKMSFQFYFQVKISEFYKNFIRYLRLHVNIFGFPKKYFREQ